MFTNLKDKLLTVKKTVGIFNNSKYGDHLPNNVNRINLEAGAELLTYFQNEWTNLHSNSKNNGKLANEIAITVNKTSANIIKSREDLGLMTHILLNSHLSQNITNCVIHIKQLFESFNNVEKELVDLEDLIETVEFEDNKKQHNYHLEQFKLRKKESLENYEKKLKEQYDKDTAEIELKRIQELEERQQVFQEAFKNDLEMFKSFGTIPKLDLPRKKPSALLEEIQVDYDENELNQFFEENTSSTQM